MSRPTEQARDKFTLAANHLMTAGQALTKTNSSAADQQLANVEMIRGLWDLATGLGMLSTGMRATYILLEEVKGMMQRPR